MSLPTAKVITDSISPDGIRLTTLQLRYPRFIHSEFMTHRVFSRNASSSRAIPVAHMIEELKRDPAMPVFWGSNKPGMQAGAELDGEDRQDVVARWLLARDSMIAAAQRMMEFGLHKQLANRILEPWAHINVVVTATEWSNFFALRCHEAGQPEIRVLAATMLDAMADSVPRSLLPGDWHLPYVTDEERCDAYHGPSQAPEMNKLIRISVARCARVSYLTHEGKPSTVEEDLALYDRLVGSHPMHASPAEHQATPDRIMGTPGAGWNNPHLHGNLHGWIQYRKTLAGENITRA